MWLWWLSWYYAKNTNTNSLFNTFTGSVCCRMDHSSSWSGLEETCRRSDWSNPLCRAHLLKKKSPNDVMFSWFTDKNIFTLATLKNSHTNQLYTPAATKKDVTFFAQEWLSVSCCWLVKIGLHWFDVIWSQIQNLWNCYCGLLLPQQMLPVVYQFSGKFRNSAPVYRSS